MSLEPESHEFLNFIDQANIAQGIIPEDILARKDIVKSLPAFFRTIPNEKPTKDEIDKLIKLIRES